MPLKLGDKVEATITGYVHKDDSSDPCIYVRIMNGNLVRAERDKVKVVEQKLEVGDIVMDIYFNQRVKIISIDGQMAWVSSETTGDVNRNGDYHWVQFLTRLKNRE